MRSKKPERIREYTRWLKDELGVEIPGRARTRYDTVTSRISAQFQASSFWRELSGDLPDYDSQYRLDTQYPLFIELAAPKIQIKPFASLVQKTFRKNVRDNERWPDEPEGGWIVPDNWFSRINDIIRTLFVVKYLDGVDFLTRKIGSLCEQQGQPCDAFLEAREEGYYAAHLYTKQGFEIPSVTWDTERVEVQIELQITTQLQEVIRRLLHKYYEERRKRPRRDPEFRWQWDYKSDEFVAAYLGHILHYVEGMIMEIRESQREEYYDRAV